MCGIAGWYHASPPRDDDVHRLEAMIDRLRHRGPDDRGAVVEGPARLAHARLSIIDRAGGAQPMRDPSGRRVVVFNGEIYNFRELRRDLERAGYRFRTNSDTEVLLAVYDHDGIAGLDRLAGMFALALWDGARGVLHVVRDRLGIKPLVWAVAPDGAFVFASEPKALFVYPGVVARARLGALCEYLTLRHAPGSETFFEGVHRLEPGHRLEVDARGVRVRRWWSPPRERFEALDAETLIDRTADLVERAVTRRLVADVPVGAFLSGGLDSSLVVAMMARASGEPVRTFAIGFAGTKRDDADERDWARRVATACGTRHRDTVIDARAYVERLPDVVAVRDAPPGVPNEVALWELTRMLREDVTVVLSGEGADELFAGYGRMFRSPDDLARLRDAAFMHGPHALAFLEAARCRYGRVAFDDDADFFLERYAYVPFDVQRAVLTPDALPAGGPREAILAHVREAFADSGQSDTGERFLAYFQRHHLENLLARVDAMTMAHSVEARVPFVDHELVEHVVRIPLGAKVRWKSARDERLARQRVADAVSEVHDVPKAILRDIARRWLPPAIVDRRKTGFPVPLDAFGRGALARAAREVLLDPACRRRGVMRPRALEARLARIERGGSHREAMTVWMLMNIELWLRTCVDGAGTAGREDDHARDHSGGGTRRAPLSADPQYAQEPA